MLRLRTKHLSLDDIFFFFFIFNLVGSNQCFFLGGFFLFEMVEKNVFEVFDHQIWICFLGK